MTVPRELRITYGTIATDGTAGGCNVELIDVHRLFMSSQDFEVGYSILITSPITTTYAAAVTAFGNGCAAVEAVLSKDRQAIKVDTLDPSDDSVRKNLLTLQHSDNSGLNIRCEFEKPGSEHDTNLSRLYRVRVSGEVPPPGLSGRREFSWSLDLTPATVGTLTVRGTYTAISGTQSKAQYDASIATRVATITTALTGTWELQEEKVGPVDDTDQVTQFERVYKELIHDQSSGTRDNSILRDVRLEIQRSKLGAEGDRSERKLARISVSYSAFVVKTTTDLAGTWTNTVKPWILTNVRTYLDDSRLAVVDWSPSFDPFENRITASVEILAPSGGNTLRRIVVTTDDIDFGRIVRYTWPKTVPSDKDELKPTEAYVFRGPKLITRTIFTTTTTLGTGTAPRISGSAAGGGVIPVGIGAPRWDLGLGDPFKNFLGVGVISKPGESFLSFSEAGSGGGGGGFGISGAGGGGGSGPMGVLKTVQTTYAPRVEGVYPDQFDVTDTTRTEVYEIVLGLGGGGGRSSSGGGGPASNKNKTTSRTGKPGY